MIAKEELKRLAQCCVQYDITLNGENTKTVLSKGINIHGDDLIHFIWNIIPNCYLQMKNKNDSMCDKYALYLRVKLTELLNRDDFWSKPLGADFVSDIAKFSSDKFIRISCMSLNGDIDIVFKADSGLYGPDFLYGLCSLIKNTYTDLCYEDNTSARWLKLSMEELVKLDSFWTEKGVSENQMDTIRMKFFSSDSNFS